MSRYKADIAGGALKLPDSRVIAGLLLRELSADEWKHAIEVENVLQKKSPSTAKRQSALIRSRLMTMDAELWHMVRDGSHQVATHAMFASAIKHSTLISDFLITTVREHFLTFKPTLPRNQWQKFLDRCQNSEPDMPHWAKSTADKLGDSVYQILTEVGFIDGRSYTLKPVRISPVVLSYLREREEFDVIRCMQVSS